VRQNVAERKEEKIYWKCDVFFLLSKNLTSISKNKKSVFENSINSLCGSYKDALSTINKIIKPFHHEKITPSDN